MDPITAAALRRKFPPEQIEQTPRSEKRPALDYVSHATTTQRLLEVDPDWTWTPMGRNPDGTPALDREGNLWILLTVGGVTRPGVGDANNGKGMKEAIGDALRNAAMRFGVALDLWAKADLWAEHIVTDDAWLATIRDLIDGATTDAELDAVARRIAVAVEEAEVGAQDVRDLRDLWRARKADLRAEAAT